MLTAYVVLDGFDLGVGIIFPFVARSEKDRQQALCSRSSISALSTGFSGVKSHSTPIPMGTKRLEEKSEGEDEAVVVAVELAGGDLFACTEADAQSTLRFFGTQRESAEDDAWGEELLTLAVVGTAMEVGGV